jgi:hypothetical protein
LLFLFPFALFLLDVLFQLLCFRLVDISEILGLRLKRLLDQLLNLLRGDTGTRDGSVLVYVVSQLLVFISHLG